MRTSRVASWRDRVLPLVAPALLVAVATVQVVRAQTLDQSSWKGTGFGMFATFETAATRYPVAFTGDGDRLAVPNAEELRDAQIVPSDSNLEALAERIAELNGVAAGDTVRVELWAVELRFRGDDLQHRIRPRWSAEVTVS